MIIIMLVKKGMFSNNIISIRVLTIITVKIMLIKRFLLVKIF